MIDLHSHILYGIDDGPAELRGSLSLARTAAAAGVTRIAATPHVNSRFGVTAADRDPVLARVREAIAQEGIALEVIPGAEIALDRFLELDEAQLDQLRLGDGPYLLLECPLSQAAGAFDHLLATLLDRGVRMLLAHPERCPDFQRRPERLARLVARGALAQVTSGSLAGRFGGTVQRTALTMLGEGLVHDLASDAHDAVSRGPDLRVGLEAAARALPGSAALADWLTLDVPAAVLSGATVPPRPALPVPPPRRARFLTRLRGG